MTNPPSITLRNGGGEQPAILADARSFISRAWWLGVFPGLFVMITVLSINFLGDTLRDLLDLCEAKDLAHV